VAISSANSATAEEKHAVSSEPKERPRTAKACFAKWNGTVNQIARTVLRQCDVARSVLRRNGRSDHSAAVLLDVLPHGSWSAGDLIRILRRTEPDAVPRLSGLSQEKEFSEAEYLRLREAAILVPLGIRLTEAPPNSS